MSLRILARQVHGSSGHESLNCRQLAVPHCVVQRCLALVVDEVWVGASVKQHIEHLQVALAGRIKQGRLPIRVCMVHLAAVRYEQVHEFGAIIARCIK